MIKPFSVMHLLSWTITIGAMMYARSMCESRSFADDSFPEEEGGRWELLSKETLQEFHKPEWGGKHDITGLLEIQRLGAEVRDTTDLWKSGYIEIRLGAGWAGGGKGLASFRRVFRLDELTVADQILDADTLTKLVKVPHLQALHLLNCATTARTLRALAAPKELRLLHLSGKEIDDDALAAIKELDLMWLIIGPKSHVSDTGVGYLRGMTSLVSLRVLNARIFGRGFDALSRLTRLRELVASNTDLDDQSLTVCKAWRQLNRIDLSGTRVEGCGLSHLTGLTRLREINLSHTAISDRTIGNVLALKTLNALFLDGTEITDAAMAQLVELSELRTLSLRETAVTEKGLHSLVRLENLKVVYDAKGRLIVFDPQWITTPEGGRLHRLREHGQDFFSWSDLCTNTEERD